MQHRKVKKDIHGQEEQDLGIADLPQAFPDDDLPVKEKVEEPVRRRQRGKPSSSSSGSSSSWVIPFTLLVIVVVVVSYFLVEKHEEARLEHLRKDIVHDQIEPLSKQWEVKYANLQEENENLRSQLQELEELRTENRKLHSGQDNTEQELETQQHLVEYFKKYKVEIKRRIKMMSHSLLLEKFGPGPHHVEIEVMFDPETPGIEELGSEPQRILIEMAPADQMPHVVYWFLEQVTRGLYDGSSFHRNAGHVVQGGPLVNFLTPPDVNLRQRFFDAGFVSILFQEYSPDFRHEKYTLGLAGRPGGPDFYVSTKNNTKLHGPGGQTSYEDPLEADPCFAKVIEGFDVVDRMQTTPLKPGNYKAMEKNVAIISMKLVPEIDVGGTGH
eukprot:Nitzschia sp. Nitz4//scaffold1_size375055//132931//134143//NITZ4_000252-RA/size375055-augustus-gene-0.714-mRNA-1//-1//CDS//3329540973//1994//frame0